MNKDGPNDWADEPNTPNDSPVMPKGGWRRVIGRHSGERPGPKLLCIAGIHGNEPAGAHALRRVFCSLKERGIPFQGELVGLAGNLRALKAGARYLERDMNRMWTDELIARALQPPKVGAAAPGPGSGHDAEWAEVADLHDALEREVDGAKRDVFLLDLHTSSADGVPFACLGDTMRNRRFARPFPVPVLLGLEEKLDGALLEYLNNRGVITMGFEAGQHDAMHSIDRHEAGIWIGLAAAGCFPGPMPEQVEAGRRLLADARGGLPKVLEILHRHALRPQDDFRMRPGYENFTPAQEGEVLAEDKAGLIHAPRHGHIMLPLYQGKGDDGFFLAKRVHCFWLKLGAGLRALRIDRALPWLPGVRLHPDRPGHLLVSIRISRFYPAQLFYLLGYRKWRRKGGYHLVSRRQHDLKRPRTLCLRPPGAP
ncbi:MAG: succinylglutamate desuccinylase/aspartoacylase family protein [Planctomycetes bacterium]|nr:succinylglutamate desuccinylase/aspartoacylase family protein [Planctomycetota bacterium]